MSDKVEALIRQLLEKTQGGKLAWHFAPSASGEDSWLDTEDYVAELGDGSSFLIGRRQNGDNKVINFGLTQPANAGDLSSRRRVVLTAQADNFPISPESLQILEPGRSILGRGRVASEPTSSVKIARFRLFSDLFHAARESAVIEDQTIEKVQQLLERLG